MTADDCRRLDPDQLQGYFSWLRAEALPAGTFNGKAWSFDVPLVSLVSRVWQGKIFTGATAINRIAGLRMIRGVVRLRHQTVELRYPQLGLVDELKPVSATCWLGRLEVKRLVIWFTLEAA